MDPQTDFESGEWVAKTIIAQMEKLIEVEKYGETAHAGTVYDNVSCNRTSSRLIEENYPKNLPLVFALVLPIC